MDRLFQRVFAPVPPAPTKIPPPHPFYPLGVEIANYVANDMDVPTMVGSFFAAWFVLLGFTWVAVGSYKPQMKRSDKLVLIWFVLTGTIHTFFEGYFALNHTRMGSAQDLFGQLWKEYSMSDSRYLTSDPFVLCMESITAFMWGPLSYIVVYMILKNHSLRHPIQALVCIGQIYGLILYYATSMFDLYYKDLEYCRPEPYYFWFYFFFTNFIWMVIPGYLLYQSFSTIGQAFDALKRMSASMQGNGAVKVPKTVKSQ